MKHFDYHFIGGALTALIFIALVATGIFVSCNREAQAEQKDECHYATRPSTLSGPDLYKYHIGQFICIVPSNGGIFCK